MKNFYVRVMTFSAFVVASSIALTSTLHAAGADMDDAECSQEILLAYFPGVFLDATLDRFNIPQEKRDAIKKELAVKDKAIIKIVEEKASKMNPNPLRDPQQRQVAVKIFRETLFENFASVLKAHGVTDDKKIQSMLDDIQEQKAKRFARCMSLQKVPAASSTTGSNADDDDDNDDDSDDDNEDDDEDEKKQDKIKK